MVYIHRNAPRIHSLGALLVTAEDSNNSRRSWKKHLSLSSLTVRGRDNREIEFTLKQREKIVHSYPLNDRLAFSKVTREFRLIREISYVSRHSNIRHGRSSTLKASTHIFMSDVLIRDTDIKFR